MDPRPDADVVEYEVISKTPEVCTVKATVTRDGTRSENATITVDYSASHPLAKQAAEYGDKWPMLAFRLARRRAGVEALAKEKAATAALAKLPPTQEGAR